MREIVAATLCVPLAVILLNGCAGPVTEADRQLASKFDHELYLAGRNTPAEYAVNQMCSNVLNTMLLKEELVPRDPMRYQTARERLKTLEEDIRKGFEWPEYPLHPCSDRRRRACRRTGLAGGPDLS